MSTKSFKKNFSLIELLAVIAIMSMLIAIVGAAMKPDPVGSAARELSASINKARSYALSKRKYTVVHITHPEGNDKFAQIEPIRVYTDNVCDPADNTKFAIPSTVPGSTISYLNKGANITSDGNREVYISFHPNGGVNINASKPDTGAVFMADNEKYYIDIQKRGDNDSKVTLYINRFTGMTSFKE